MKPAFHEHLESLYVKTNIENQTNYHPYLAAKTQAVQNLLNLQKTIYRWLSYFAILKHYFDVKMNVVDPLPKAQELVKQYQDKKNNG